MTEFTPCIDTTVIVQTKARESWKEKSTLSTFLYVRSDVANEFFFAVLSLLLYNTVFN